MYSEFEKKLKVIRRKRRVSNYDRWSESRISVDEFYRKNTFSADILYDRLTSLKRKSETFKLIAIPVYITLVFGIFLTLGINTILFFLEIKSKFLVDSKKILDKTLLTLSSESAQKATALYDQIVNETLFEYMLLTVFLIICLIIIAVLLAYLLYPLYRLNNSKLVVYEYEIDTIRHQLNALEIPSNIETKTLLKLENKKYLLEYTLTKVTKK